jgi:hypothetical protein
MATFPALTPSEAPITPGAWPATEHKSLNGAEASIRHGSAEIGRTWRPRFINITETDFLAILNHYRGQRSGFDSFGFTTTTLAADLTPAGFAWLYASRPQVVDQHRDSFTVQCEFKCEPRGLVVVPGKTWRTQATTFTIGGRGGDTVFGRSAAWATSSTTFTPGDRTGRYVVADGVNWATSSTTLTRGDRSNGLDTYFSSVYLLLHMNGSNGSTSFPDSSSNSFTVTVSGDAQVSTTDPKFGSGSLTLDGTGDYLSVNMSSLINIGSQDFTAECWAYINTGNTGTKCLFCFEGSSFRGPGVLINSGNWVLRYANTESGSMGAVTTGAWQHVALARSGNSLRLFINGSQLGSTLTDTAVYIDRNIGIGFAFGIGDSPSARIDELRITVGVARYTANFTPPAAAFPDA